MVLDKNMVGGLIRIDSYFVTTLEQKSSKKCIIINNDIRFICEEGICAKEILSKLLLGENVIVSYGNFKRVYIRKKGEYIEILDNEAAELDEIITAKGKKY